MFTFEPALRKMEVSFPIFPTTAPKTTSATKINIITPSIPLSDARLVNLILLITGTSLNFLIIFVIMVKSTMRTSPNLYVISLACSNMVILLEPFEEVLRWFFDVHIKLNMDYVCMISFDVSVITIAVLKFMLYIGIFPHQTSFAQTLMKKSNSLKGIFLVWTACITSLAIGLHIYDFFEGDMAEIYVWNTLMFIFLPFLIFLALDCLIIYELTILKSIEGSWRMEELRRFITLVIVTIAFYLIRMPYRLARAINFMEPKAVCCTDSKREVLYFIAKTYPTVFSLVYIFTSCEFDEAYQDILRYRCKKPCEAIEDATAAEC